ncbi:polysaccharide biosynthesis protein [Pseudomonas aeruginosa]
MIDGLRVRLLGLPRRYKRILQVLADVALVWLSLWLAFLVRLGTEDMISPFEGHAWLFIAAPLVAIPLFIRFGMYRAVMRYLGNDALIAIAKAVTISALVLSLLVYWYRSPPAVVPRSLVFNYWWLSMLLIGGLRLAMRQYFMGDWYSAVQSVPFLNRQDGLPRVAIYGAGAAGNQLVAALRLGRAMRPVAFIDDDKQIANRVIAGLRVYTAKHIRQMIDETGAQEVLLAIPSATRARRREILESLEPFPLHVRSMPGFMDLASGRVKVDDLQEVDIADLLGRDSVAPRKELLERCIRGQVVMVTGAGGSIGSELCRQIMSCSPSVLILFEHSEYNLYSIHQELERRIKRESLSVNLLPILGSVRNPERLAEMVLQALSNESAPVLFGDRKDVHHVNKTRFTMVRFGNVLGSSGSVIPLFREQIKRGGPVTVTHPSITRYFMTIPEAAQLVIQAGSMGQGGDVFVLDMGPPVKILELAEKMIHLSGLSVRSERSPHGDIAIEFSGLRPGEKLYEELLIGDNVNPTDHPMIMRANEEHLSWEAFKVVLEQLLAAVEKDDYSRVRQLLRETVSGYAPDGEIVDWIYRQRRREP